MSVIEMLRDEFENNMAIVKGYNSVTSDMKHLRSCFAIEMEGQSRLCVVQARWELAKPLKPIEVKTYYYTDPKDIEHFGLEHIYAFRDEAMTDAHQKEMNIGLMKCKGTTPIHAESGVVHQINTYYGRHAPSIVAFLEGKEDFDKIDTSYDNSWGAWA